MTIFKTWWNTQIITPNLETCSSSPFFYPGTLATPSYKNVYIDPPTIPSGWSVQNVAIFAGVPDMVLPLGQAAYNSTIPEHVEYVPVALNVIAAPGFDGVVFELARRLQGAGIINALRAGSTMYGRSMGGGLE